MSVCDVKQKCRRYVTTSDKAFLISDAMPQCDLRHTAADDWQKLQLFEGSNPLVGYDKQQLNKPLCFIVF